MEMLAPRFTYFLHDEKGPSRAGSDTNYRRWGTSWLMPRGLFTSLHAPQYSCLEDLWFHNRFFYLYKPHSTLVGCGQTKPNGTPECSQQATAQIFISLVLKRLKVTSSHELSGKTVISSGRQCRSWRDHFCQKSQQGERPQSERLEGNDGILQQLWALSTNSGSALHLGLLIILS